MLTKETRESLAGLGIDPETVEWISVNDYLKAPLEEVAVLHEDYRVISLSHSDTDKLFIVPVGNNRCVF